MTTNEGQASVVDWVKQRWYGTTVLMCVFCLMLGTGLAMVIGRTAPGPYWIIFGGNTDPGTFDGQGLARDQMVGGGWVSYQDSVQVHWSADISQGSERSSAAAMPAGHAAINQFCRNRPCIIAGFSLGTIPALRLASEAGIPASNTYIFGGPQPSTGIWHQPYIDNPFIAPFVGFFGNFNLNQKVRPGTQVFYNSRDPYANSAPQCGGPGLFLLGLDGHYILSRGEADGSHIWTGPDGAVMHEAGYQRTPFGLPRSGSDPSQIWDFCPPNIPKFGLPAMNGDPGVPQLPGIPTR